MMCFGTSLLSHRLGTAPPYTHSWRFSKLNHLPSSLTFHHPTSLPTSITQSSTGIHRHSRRPKLVSDMSNLIRSSSSSCPYQHDEPFIGAVLFTNDATILYYIRNLFWMPANLMTTRKPLDMNNKANLSKGETMYSWCEALCLDF